MVNTESQYIKLVDYVAEMRSKLQHANTRSAAMEHNLNLLRTAKAEQVEVNLWEEAMREHAKFIDILEEQLVVYETLVGWR